MENGLGTIKRTMSVIYEEVANEVIPTIREAETYWEKMGKFY